MTNEELYRDLSDSERMEQDWRQEQRAEARFLLEMNTPFHGSTATVPEQLNLFEEAL